MRLLFTQRPNSAEHQSNGLVSGEASREDGNGNQGLWDDANRNQSNVPSRVSG